jgi:poly [ADP-ribose] polymerase 6/8
LTPTGIPDDRKVANLTSQGFDRQRASHALVLCQNDTARAITFLRTGERPPTETHISVDYATCPLIYLVLEIAEAFLDLSDHCCICRQELVPGVKPSICEKQLCKFQLTNIGLGTPVIQEIRRDPMAADFILSIFSAAIGTKFLVPEPPDFRADELLRIFQELPSVRDMASCGETDQQLIKLIGNEAVKLLRWVLLGTQSHLIALPNELKLPEFPCTCQFMSLMSSPHAEDVLGRMKQQFGTFYLWHGSGGDRWYSILRNGLKNASGTALQAHGAARGPGIYFAPNSQMSWGYSHVAANRYAKSQLGANLQVISLCEVAKIGNSANFRLPRKGAEKSDLVFNGFLKNHKDMYTLSIEEACVVRFIFVQGSFGHDVVQNPPKRVPTLHDFLEFQASRKK